MVEEPEKRDFEFGLPSIGIPAEVLFNPELLPSEKILFGFIRNLSKTKRGCWASNRTLGLFINCGKQMVSNSIAKLKKYGYIRIEFVRKEKLTKKKERRIYEDPTYKERYRQLVEAFHEFYIKGNIGIKEDINGYITTVIRGYTDSYRKERDTEKDIENDSEKESLSKDNDNPSSDGTPPKSKLHNKKLSSLNFDKASDNAKQILESWNACKNLTTHRKNTKIVGRAMWLLDKRILRKKKPVVVCNAISEFNDLVGSSKHSRLKGVSICDFLEWPKYVLDSKKEAGQDSRTWFEKIIEKGNDFIEYKDLIDSIKVKYKKFVLGNDNGVEFTVRDDMNFLAAAKKIRDYAKNGRLRKYIPEVSEDDYINFMFKALDDCWGFGDVSPGTLASNYTYREVLPKFITKHFDAPGQEVEYEVVDERDL